MNCLVTAGPTYESLDQVRRLTNFSTGQLGSELARFLSAQGHRVILLRGYYSIHCESAPNPEAHTFTTTADLGERLQSFRTGGINAVFHAAAVSDFTFGRVFAQSASGKLDVVAAGKLSTRQGPLLAELIPTPKLISELRGWFPDAYLAGWKYEVDGAREDAVQAGMEQIRRCHTDACVVNGPAYGQGFGLLNTSGELSHVPSKHVLFETLGRALEHRLGLRS